LYPYPTMIAPLRRSLRIKNKKIRNTKRPRPTPIRRQKALTPIVDEVVPKRRCENIWKLACKRRVGYLYDQYTPQTIRAVVAAQAESESLFNPIDDDDDDEDDDDDDYEIDVDLGDFDSAFTLDFSESSPPPTPPPSLVPITLPSPITLFSSTSPSLPFPPPPLSSLPVLGLPDTEPTAQYMGRGTPVDRRRRGDWSGQLALDDPSDPRCGVFGRKSPPPESWSGFGFHPSAPHARGVNEWGAFLESLLGGINPSVPPAALPSDTIDASAEPDISWYELGIGGPIPTPAATPAAASLPTISVGDDGFEGQTSSSTLSFALG
jgi:hypothetical protein